MRYYIIVLFLTFKSILYTVWLDNSLNGFVVKTIIHLIS